MKVVLHFQRKPMVRGTAKVPGTGNKVSVGFTQGSFPIYPDSHEILDNGGINLHFKSFELHEINYREPWVEGVKPKIAKARSRQRKKPNKKRAVKK